MATVAAGSRQQQLTPAIELDYAKLVRTIGRLFYARKNNGLHCLLLNLLVKHEWIKEDFLASQLGLSWRQVRRVLRELQQDYLITRIHMKDSKSSSSSLTAQGSNTHSYCCLNYKGMFDSCRLKMHKLRQYFKGEDEKTKIDDYVCSDPECRRTYTSLEALDLEVDQETFLFLCEYCGSPLEKGGSSGTQDKDALEKKKAKENLKRQQLLFEKELKPFAELLKRLQPYNPPYFGTLQEWATAQAKIRQASLNGESLDGEEDQTGLVIEFEDDQDEDNGAGEEQKVQPKELPPWMRLGYQDVKASEPPAPSKSLSQLESVSNQDTATNDDTYSNGKRALEEDDNENIQQQQAKKAKTEGTSDDMNQAHAHDVPPAVAEEDDDDVEWEDM